MKAVLEFNYPDDEDKLRHALHAENAFTTLNNILVEVQHDWDGVHKAQLLNALKHIRLLVEQSLESAGEI
jgi:hypothetical protein